MHWKGGRSWKPAKKRNPWDKLNAHTEPRISMQKRAAVVKSEVGGGSQRGKMSTSGTLNKAPLFRAILLAGCFRSAAWSPIPRSGLGIRLASTEALCAVGLGSQAYGGKESLGLTQRRQRRALRPGCGWLSASGSDQQRIENSPGFATTKNRSQPNPNRRNNKNEPTQNPTRTQRANPTGRDTGPKPAPRSWPPGLHAPFPREDAWGIATRSHRPAAATWTAGPRGERGAAECEGGRQRTVADPARARAGGRAGECRRGPGARRLRWLAGAGRG